MPVRRMSLKKWIVGNYERLSVEDRARYGDMVIVTANGTYSGKAVWGAEDMEKELAFKINAWLSLTGTRSGNFRIWEILMVLLSCRT